jgi:carbonic anhydrase
MDARIELAAALGLRLGQAHLLRNAGGLPTDDMLRSLAVSQHMLGTREVMVVHHTDCGMLGLDDAAFRAELAESTGSPPSWDVPGFSELEPRVRTSVGRLRDCPWLPHRDQVRGFVFDVATGRLQEVPAEAG